MTRRNRVRLVLACTAMFAVGAAAWMAQEQTAQAADHNDPSGRVGNQEPEDIADLYAWHSADGTTMTVVLTFGGPTAPAADQMGAYDPDVLYGIHYDTTGDGMADGQSWIRFAQNDLGDWGVEVTGLPGEAADSPVVGAVETTIDAPNGGKVFTGLRDDPFFFDLAGFLATLNTGTLSFTGADSFAGMNATAIVLEFPVAAVAGVSQTVSVWATTSRI